MFFENFITEVYEFIGDYIRSGRQTARFARSNRASSSARLSECSIHHSLNNILVGQRTEAS